MVKRGLHFFVAVAVVGCATRSAKSRPDGGGGVESQQDSAGGGAGGSGPILIAGGIGGASSLTAAVCGSPANPGNGSVSVPAYTHGSTATYSCTPGFALSGSATRTCQTDGTWSGDVPTCVAVDAVCETPAGIANGVVSAPITKYGATASYFCSSGYSLQGDATRTCQADGTWDGTEPTCTCDVTCNDMCTDIQMDSNNCGGCGTICPSVPAPSTTQCMLGRCLVTLATLASVESVRDIAVDNSSLYWTVAGWAADGNVNHDSLNKVPLGGGTPTPLVSDDNMIENIAVDAFGVYWVRWVSPMTDSTYDIMKVPLAGGTPTTLANGGQSWIALGAGGVYWMTGSALMRVSLDGGTPVPVASVQGFPSSIAVDAAYVYWTKFGTFSYGSEETTDGTVMKVPVGGGTPIMVASAQDAPHALVVDATSVYWIAGGSVMKMPLDGGSPVTLVSGRAPFSSVASIAVDGSSVYWTNGADLYSGGAVMKAPLGGGTPTKLALAQDSPGRIAVDDTSVYWATRNTVVKVSPK
ncbi:MAG: hypothetical protein WCG85_02260 [Polyangia bacterium]